MCLFWLSGKILFCAIKSDYTVVLSCLGDTSTTFHVAKMCYFLAGGCHITPCVISQPVSKMDTGSYRNMCHFTTCVKNGYRIISEHVSFHNLCQKMDTGSYRNMCHFTTCVKNGYRIISQHVSFHNLYQKWIQDHIATCVISQLVSKMDTGSY